MKKLATLLLALILSFPLVTKAQSIQPPKGFDGDVYGATFALYAKTGSEDRFVCTATAYEKIPAGYHLIGAGHCVADVGADSYSVAETIGGKETPVKVLKFEMDADADLAQFELDTDKQYPVIPLGTDVGLRIGQKIVNVNFAIGIAKQLSYGVVSSDVFKNDGGTDTFLVQASGAPGSSGSSVISEDTHKIVGIWIYGFSDSDGAPVNIGGGVEPIDKFQAFLTRVIAPAPSISDQEFTQNFGPEHPFTLAVHGPSPVFVVGGHTFQAKIMGFELSDEYYYDVPVYIIRSGRGFRLVSTKEGVGVDIDLIM